MRRSEVNLVNVCTVTLRVNRACHSVTSCHSQGHVGGDASPPPTEEYTGSQGSAPPGMERRFQA